MKAFKNTTKLLKVLTYNLGQDRNYFRNTFERTENNLKEHEGKVRKQLNSDKAVDQNIKKTLNTLESFQDHGNPWLTVCKNMENNT